jgi:hypothetical protein
MARMTLESETIYLCNSLTGVVKAVIGWRIPDVAKNADGTDLTDKQQADRQKNWYVEEGAGGFLYNNKYARANTTVCEDLETAIYFTQEWCSEQRRRVSTAYRWMADHAAAPPKDARQKREAS